MPNKVDVQGLTPVLPVDDLRPAVEQWRKLLGVEPTFVDGDRWAQFDVGGRRFALSGTDRTADVPGLMIKVADVHAAREAALQAGLQAQDVQRGKHEMLCTVTGPGGWPIVFYSPLKP